MSRGLGRQQRTVLAALRQLECERGPGWRSPAEVVATVAAMTRVEPAMPEAPPDPDDKLLACQLAGARSLVEVGRYEYEATVMLIERRIAEKAAADRARWEVEREARRKREEAGRAPNQRRPEPRGGEAGNPSRVLALLERRGLVERQAHCGPGAVVRLIGVREAAS